MSKASEWARNYGKRPEIRLGSDGVLKSYLVISVGDNGELCIGYDKIISAKDAVSVGKWIIETFSEDAPYAPSWVSDRSEK